jgi:hypothetical protein
MWIFSSPSTTFEEAKGSLFSNVCFGHLYKDSDDFSVWVYFWSPILFHWSTCMLLWQLHAVFISIALQYNRKSNIIIPPALLFSLKISLAIQAFVLPYVLIIFFKFWSYSHFTILILLIHEHWRAFHLLISSLIF